MSSQPDVALPADVVQGVASVARALVAAIQNWTLYPPQHPTVQGSLDRFADALARATAGGRFSIGITPQTLLFEGRPVPPPAAGGRSRAAPARP